MDNEQNEQEKKKPLTVKDFCLGTLGIFIILAIFAIPMMLFVNFLLPVFGIENQFGYRHALAFAGLLFCMGRCISPAK